MLKQLTAIALATIAVACIMDAGKQEREMIEATRHDPPPVTAVEVWMEPETDEAPPYLGDFRVTAYTPECDGGVWGYQTATGVTSQHLATCAVDPDVIPLGTVLDIGGELIVTAVDTGSAVKGNVIDVFYDGSREEALDWIAEFGDSAPVWVQQEVK